LSIQDWSNYYRLWGTQLYHEFHSICFQYGLSLEPPVFVLTESQTQLGSWQPEKREIRMSSCLIRTYSWDITLEVLKHEIAHQICTELFHEFNGGHGPSFQKACDILGVPGCFRLSCGDLPHGLKENRQENNVHRILEKIRKLLSLAESSNEHEAKLAMETAGRLLKKYNIEMLGDENPENYVYSIINRKKKRIDAYQSRIVKILTQFFYVKAIYSSIYDPIEHEKYRTIEIFGKNENVEIAKYCYHFLERKLLFLWKERKLQCSGNKRIARKSFSIGVLQGFHDTLLDQERASGKGYGKSRTSQLTDCELIVAGDKELDRFIHARYPRLQKRSRTGGKIYSDFYDRGVQEGRRLIFNKGIKNDIGNKGIYLE